MKSDSIAQLLPAVVRRTRSPGDVLDGVLGAMEQLHAPVDAMLVDFDRYIDPYRCPVDFVPYLAEWVGLGWLVGARRDGAAFPTGDGPLRDLIASAEPLAKERGTVHGLSRMLELATAHSDFDVVVAAEPAFHVVVTCPEQVRVYHDLISLIIRHEKPAFVTADIAIGNDAPVRLGTTNETAPSEEPHA